MDIGEVQQVVQTLGRLSGQQRNVGKIFHTIDKSLLSRPLAAKHKSHAGTGRQTAGGFDQEMKSMFLAHASRVKRDSRGIRDTKFLAKPTRYRNWENLFWIHPIGKQFASRGIDTLGT